jgi:hypothetical protein
VRRAALTLLLTLGLAACTGGEEPTADSPAPLAVAWVEADLPPAPPGWRVAVRDAAWCDDHWLVVGGVLRPGGEYGDLSRPAAWTSTDGSRWVPVRIRPHTYYGRGALLTSVACRGSSAAAVGAQPGGAHANPRVTTFRTRADGTWVDVEAPVPQYGGEHAVGVGPVAAGPRGWLIAGNRTSGPAVWVGRTAQDFDIVEDAPGLADERGLRALAQDGVWNGTGWTVVGGALIDGEPGRQPQAWLSADGRRWQREQVPASDEYADLLALARTDAGVLAAGLRDRRFGTWLRDENGWQEGPAFGAVADDARASPYVAGLAAAGGHAYAAVSDGVRYRLWFTDDGASWREAAVPVAPETAGDHTLGVAATDAAVLLLADDGTAGRVWLADPPAVG